MTSSTTPHATKGYHRECTGQALDTVRQHAELPSNGLTLFSAAFCPFAQRAWMTLEFLGIPYRYIEVDPYEKPASLLEVNSNGLVPSLRLEKGSTVQGLGESTVIIEYLHERYVDAAETAGEKSKKYLLPSLKAEGGTSVEDATYLRAQYRLISHHINGKLIPGFYRFLQAQESDQQIQLSKEFVDDLKWFQDRLEESDKGPGAYGGPFFAGQHDLTLVDVMFAPWAHRARNVLKHYRSLDLASATLFPSGSRYHTWAQAVFATDAFKATTSTDQLYLDSYQRYAENRPNTSQVANAINSGRGLP